MSFKEISAICGVPAKKGQIVKYDGQVGTIVDYFANDLMVKWDNENRTSKYHYSPLMLDYWVDDQWVNYRRVIIDDVFYSSVITDDDVFYRHFVKKYRKISLYQNSIKSNETMIVNTTIGEILVAYPIGSSISHVERLIRDKIDRQWHLVDDLSSWRGLLGDLGL